MSKAHSKPTPIRDRIFEDAPVVVLAPPEDMLKSPIFDDAKQIAALPDNLEDQ
ncbi:MAG TPA: hypothetical protein VFC00_30675 [Micromonosporaceae bacterium]|nr:hypothetical protein [Micromonosporaceae bacterium]